MVKYLYLTEVEWANTWIHGGEIPVKLASTYLHHTREGIKTLDENLIHESPVDLKSLSPMVHLENVKNFTMTNSFFNGQRVPDIISANYYNEDGLILSFCNNFSEEIARKLGKKACVKIVDLEKLRKRIDKQLGIKGVMKECRYTTDHQRNHFLKSTEDSWQDEYRIFWRYPKNKIVLVPSGIAEFFAEIRYE